MDILGYLDKFENYLRVLSGFSPLTIKRYTYVLVSVDSYFKGVGIDKVLDIDRGAVEEWLKKMYYGGSRKNSTRAMKLAAVRKFFSFLVYDKAILAADNPVSEIPTPKVGRIMPQKFGTEQLQGILNAPDRETAVGIRDGAILTLLYGAGPRVSEIKDLNLDDLRFSGHDIYMYIHGKGMKERTVRLRSRAAAELKRWLVIREDIVVPGGELPVFVSVGLSKRMSTVTYNTILKKYAAMAGVKNERVFAHKMRATFASDLYDMGFAIKEISILLGHNSTITTERYIAISEKALKQTAIPNARWAEIMG